MADDRHDWERTGLAQAHCVRCGEHAPIAAAAPEFGCSGARKFADGTTDYKRAAPLQDERRS